MTLVEIKPLNHLVNYLDKLTEGKLWLKVIIAMLIGILAGALLNPGFGLVSEGLSESIGNWLSLPGRLFLKLVQMIMLPLIFASIISGIVSNSSDQLKQMGLRLLLYFLLTTTISIVIGSALTMIMQPGRSVYEQNGFTTEETTSLNQSEEGPLFDNIPQAISDLIPENPLAAMVTGEMLSIVIFTIIIGIAIIQLPNKTIRPVLGFIEAIEEISMTIVSWAMLLVPYAVFGLIADLVASVGFEGLAGIGYYMIVVLLGLLILLIVYMLLVFTFGKTNPFRFLANIREVQLLAFSTTSSAAVMPLSMKTADEKLGVSSKISDFVIPVGATINMDGTAIFQCVSALFIAQAYGIEIDLMNLVLITVTIVAASIGTPAIPGGGVVILASVLQSAGIPTEGLVIIVGVDRILGMFRTAVNVTGDLTACLIFDRWQKSKPTTEVNKKPDIPS